MPVLSLIGGKGEPNETLTISTFPVPRRPVALFADMEGATPLTNPLQADANGNFFAFGTGGPVYLATPTSGDLGPIVIGGNPNEGSRVRAGKGTPFRMSDLTLANLIADYEGTVETVAALDERMGAGDGEVSAAAFDALTARVGTLETDAEDMDAAARIAALEAAVATLTARVTNLKNPDAVPVDENPNPNLMTAQTALLAPSEWTASGGGTTTFNGDGTMTVPIGLNCNVSCGTVNIDGGATRRIATDPASPDYAFRMVIGNPGGRVSSGTLTVNARTNASFGAVTLAQNVPFSIDGTDLQEIIIPVTGDHPADRTQASVSITFNAATGGTGDITPQAMTFKKAA